jgi:hypothetical protein
MDVRKLRFDAIEEAVLYHYRESGNRSIRSVILHFRHLNQSFYKVPLREIDTTAIRKYIAKRQGEGAANATINRELSTARLGFHLVERAHETRLCPYIPHLKEADARQGYVTTEGLAKVLPHLHEDARGAVELALLCGWRIRSELLTRTRDDVIDLGTENAHLYLNPQCSKNGDLRRFYFAQYDLAREIIENQIARANELERKLGRPVTALFFRHDGRPIKDIRHQWNVARRAAGLPNLLLHDMRRSTVKMLNDAGIPQAVSMQITGHKSDSVFRRYSIRSDDSVKRALARLSSHVAGRDHH